MKVMSTEFNDVKVFEPKVHSDHRGFFMESFNGTIQEELGVEFLQDNHSKSSKNVLRGLHYQWEQPMGKLIRAVKGKGIDVLIDIREDSDTFGKWQSFELSEDNHHILWAPAGFAHGFLSLEEDTHLCYKTTALHNSKCEGAINPIRSGLDIDWTIPNSEIILSEKDSSAQSFNEYTRNVKF
tara:strand:+ start:429 stop:974 length:546 start_codon:yes stop_codon:yes gene_type:complete